MDLTEMIAEAIEDQEYQSTMTQARAVLAAISASGLVIVPREPTKEMIIAVNAAALKHIGFESGWMAASVDMWKRGHKAMLSAFDKEG